MKKLFKVSVGLAILFTVASYVSHFLYQHWTFGKPISEVFRSGLMTLIVNTAMLGILFVRENATRRIFLIYFATFGLILAPHHVNVFTSLFSSPQYV